MCFSVSNVMPVTKIVRYTFVAVVSLCSVLSHAVDIKKGQIDDRIYDYLTLDNQLKVLLISDPSADKAAASLDVNVGSSHDPVDREGLAHFLEHMLFLGTKKYPDAADYQAFIGGNGGSHNAYTASENTNYFFDIDADKLAPALDRFAQFFVAPLFDATYVDRERNAVHSEYQSKIKDDFRRGYDVYRQLVNPNHPSSKFSVGSLTTLADRKTVDGLADNVRDDLLAFYQQHYSSDRMTLVVLGKESIADLKQLVIPRFSSVPLSKNSALSEKVSIPLFAKQALPFEVVSQPVSTVRRMSLSFPLPSVKEHYDAKPLSYLGSIVGHEGEGSLLSLLKSQGWAEGLSAGGGNIDDHHATFSISINLTQEGVKQRALIRSLVFHVLDVIRQKGINEWRYEEDKQLSNIAFQYREKGRSVDTARSLASQLHEYPVEEIISASYLYKKYDPELIRSLLNKMTSDNYYVTTVFPEAETDKITTHYSVPYAVTRLSEELPSVPASLSRQYQLPEKNIFVPESTTLFERDADLAEPIKLEATSANVELWARQDRSFGVPKASISLRIQSPLAASNIKAAAMNQLLVNMINDGLNERSYSSVLAGLSYSLRTNSRGFDLRIGGYNDKMNDLLKRVSRQIQKPDLDQSRFDNVKTELLRQLSNSTKQTPYRQMIDTVPTTIYSPYWSDSDIAEQLQSVTYQEVKKFSKQWLKGASLQGLFYGNIDQALLKEWQSSVVKIVKKGREKIAKARVANLSIDKTLAQAIPERHLRVDHNDVSVGLYIQGVSDSLEDQAKMALLRQVFESPFYSQLRTEQQLGYIVFLSSMSLKDVPASLMVVQSPSASVDDIQLAMQSFIAKAEIPEDLTVFQQSAASNWLEQPQKLSDNANRYWSNILRLDTSFSYRQRMVDAINKITPSQLQAYFDATFMSPSKQLWFIASKNVDDAAIQFSDDQQYYIYP